MRDEVKQKIMEWHRAADWKNPAHYPSPETASFDRWAWEFLRRNDEFNRDTADFSKITEENPWCENSAPLDHPGYLAGRTYCAKWGIDIHPHEWIAEKPDYYDSPCSFTTSYAEPIWGTYRFKGDERDYHVVPHAEHENLYRVNLNWPIEPQIQAIKRSALLNQSQDSIKQIRHHVKKFPVYLRAYDAFQASASAQEIAEVFKQEKLSVDNKNAVKGVYNADAVARRFIDGEYRFIPLIGGRKGTTPI
jgi:hypothetical protein